MGAKAVAIVPCAGQTQFGYLWPRSFTIRGFRLGDATLLAAHSLWVPVPNLTRGKTITQSHGLKYKTDPQQNLQLPDASMALAFPRQQPAEPCQPTPAPTETHSLVLTTSVFSLKSLDAPQNSHFTSSNRFPFHRPLAGATAE